MKIVIANDHAAVKMKNDIIEYIKSMNIEVTNLGTDNDDSVDYPKIAEKACRALLDKKEDFAILICGTGLGMSIAANKIKGIRAACVSDEFSAKYARLHNDANVLCFGARVVDIDKAKKIVKAFLENIFEEGRHERRVMQIKELEEKGHISD